MPPRRQQRLPLRQIQQEPQQDEEQKTSIGMASADIQKENEALTSSKLLTVSEIAAFPHPKKMYGKKSTLSKRQGMVDVFAEKISREEIKLNFGSKQGRERVGTELEEVLIAKDNDDIAPKSARTNENETGLELELGRLRINNSEERSESQPKSVQKKSGAPTRTSPRKAAVKAKSMQETTEPCTAVELGPSRQHLLPLLLESNQKHIETFEDWGTDITSNYDVIKIAEGSYGEVFKIMDRETVQTSATAPPKVEGAALHNIRALGGCIMKVIPINFPSGPGSRKYSPAANVAKEVQMLKTMDAVHGFTRYRDVYVLEGRMHQGFVDAWEKWRQDPKNDCQMGDPADSGAYSERQIWAVVEMDDAGMELESLKRPQVEEVYDVFWSVVLAIAYGEMVAEFEHRDLHISNVCYRSRDTADRSRANSIDSQSQKAPEIDEELGSKSLFGLSNLKTTIIDYTWSRAMISPVEAGNKKEEDNIKDNIAWTQIKETMHRSEGDNTEEKLQRKAGRTMFEAIQYHANFLNIPARQPAKWGEFVPRTNVIWLIYLLQVLVDRLALDDVEASSEASPKLVLVSRLRSARDVLAPLLADSKIEEIPESAGVLKEIAVTEGWLMEEDVELWKRQVGEESR